MADQCFSSQFRFRFEYFLKVRYVWFSFFAHFDYENQLPRLSSNISLINYLLLNQPRKYVDTPLPICPVGR